MKYVYDQNVMNKYKIYYLPGIMIYNLIDYVSICTGAELFILFIYIYVNKETKQTNNEAKISQIQHVIKTDLIN